MNTSLFFLKFKKVFNLFIVGHFYALFLGITIGLGTPLNIFFSLSFLTIINFIHFFKTNNNTLSICLKYFYIPYFAIILFFNNHFDYTQNFIFFIIVFLIMIGLVEIKRIVHKDI